MMPDHADLRRLRDLRAWQGPIAVEPLPGGITNRNYRVRDAGSLYAARLCVERPLLGIDRRNEVACQKAAHSLGIAPELVHHEDGVLISRYVSGRTLAAEDVRDPAFLPRLAAVLRRLHGSWDRLTGAVPLLLHLPDGPDLRGDGAPPGGPPAGRHRRMPGRRPAALPPARALRAGPLPQRPAREQHHRRRRARLARRLGIRGDGPSPLRPGLRLRQLRLLRVARGRLARGIPRIGRRVATCANCASSRRWRTSARRSGPSSRRSRRTSISTISGMPTTISRPTGEARRRLEIAPVEAGSR